MNFHFYIICYVYYDNVKEKKKSGSILAVDDLHTTTDMQTTTE